MSESLSGTVSESRVPVQESPPELRRSKRSSIVHNNYVRDPDGMSILPATAYLDEDGVSVYPSSPQVRESPTWCAALLANPDQLSPCDIRFQHIGVVKLESVWFKGAFETGSAKTGSGAKPKMQGVANLRCALRDSATIGFQGADTRAQRLCSLLHRITAATHPDRQTPYGLALIEEREFSRLRRGSRYVGDLNVHVYAGVLLFQLMEIQDLGFLFENMWTEYRGELAYQEECEEKFSRSYAPHGERYWSLSALLRRTENLGYKEMEPEVERRITTGLNVPLLPFQRDAVQFMIDRASATGSLNDHFWQRVAFTSSCVQSEGNRSIYYYCASGGILRLLEPPQVRGGALCDGVGLGGNQSECIAFILASKHPHAPENMVIPISFHDSSTLNVSRRRGFVGGKRLRQTNCESKWLPPLSPDHLLHCGDFFLGTESVNDSLDQVALSVCRWTAKTHLLILPTTAVTQWSHEFSSKAPTLQWHIWQTGISTSTLGVGKHAVDVILATSVQVHRENALSKIHWKSVILADVESIRNPDTPVAERLFNLQSESRFALTGDTHIQSLNDLSGLLTFFKIWPYTLKGDDGYWERHVERPWRDQDSSEPLDSLLKLVMMRHTKEQPGIGVGLPSVSHCIVEVQLDNSSRAVYLFIRTLIESELERVQYDAQPHLRNLADMFALARECLVSTTLVSAFAVDQARRNVLEARIHAGDESLDANPNSCLRWTSRSIADHVKIVPWKDARAFADCGSSVLAARLETETGERRSCTVCLGPCTRPCITKCGHIYCHPCIVHLIAAFQQSTTCPQCRGSLSPRDLVEVSTGNEETRVNLHNNSQPQEEKGPTANELLEEYNMLPDADSRFEEIRFDPATPSLDAKFLRHLACANITSSRFERLAELIRSEDPAVKFVLVAEDAARLDACAQWLENQGIGCVGGDMLSPKESTALYANPDDQLRNNPEKRVFLQSVTKLNDLALTAASCVVFLEPLSYDIERAAAISLVHRPGQRNEVKVVQMVTPGTFEERMVASLIGEGSPAAAEDTGVVPGTSAGHPSISKMLEVFGWERSEEGYVRRCNLHS